MFGSLSDDDKYSTQLEGKRLKNRKVRFGEVYLDITEDGPAIDASLELDAEPEFFTEIDYETDKEVKDGKEEKRRKKEQEMLVAANRKNSKPKQTDADAPDDELSLEPEEKAVSVDQKKEIEHIRDAGITKLETTRPERDAMVEAADGRKNDVPAARFLLGDNAAKLDFSTEIAEQAGKQSSGILDVMLDVGNAATQTALLYSRAVMPTQLPDLRSREAEIQL